jgi:hypothetical protein
MNSHTTIHVDTSTPSSGSGTPAQRSEAPTSSGSYCIVAGVLALHYYISQLLHHRIEPGEQQEADWR